MMIKRLAATAASLLLALSAFAQTAPQQSGSRLALIQSLDALAAKQTAARRAEIASIHTRAQAEARQKHVRATMLRLIGPLPERTPLNAELLGETSAPGIRIQKILFDSQPGFHVTALLYLPENPSTKPLPAIVMAPGHGATGKASDFAFAATFARNGFAVLSYDPIGQGERLQYPDPADPTKSLATRPTGEHGEASLQPILLGESLAKYMLWDGMRAVDFLQSRPEIDPKRIGAFGCSGGGAMTALLGALDARVAATGTACYITSFDTLLPAIGPQDGEQSTPGWIAKGLDFPDWVELAAPRPYAIIATESDMFPFAGAQTTEAESRRFYKLFSADQNLSFIHGPGGHGNLRPIQPEILAFFEQHLQGRKMTADPGSPGAPSLPASPSRVGSTTAKPEQPPTGATQVTPTGQVSTSYPNSETVFSLNLKHAATIQTPHPAGAPALAAAIRAATHEHATPGTFIAADALACCSNTLASKITKTDLESSLPPDMKGGAVYLEKLTFHTGDGATFEALLAGQQPKQSHPGILLVADIADPAVLLHLLDLARQGNVVLAVSPRPSPAGSEELKSPVLGPFYLLGLRAELVGQTLLGLRTDDVIRATDYLAAQLAAHPGEAAPITAEADGHMALVLLHAAVLDSRLTHITITHLPPSYRDLLASPLPQDLPQDLVPGVLQHYDLPDLLRAVSSRATVSPATQR